MYFKDPDPKNTQPIVVHHGWPLSADDRDVQMLFFRSMDTGSSCMIGVGMNGLLRQFSGADVFKGAGVGRLFAGLQSRATARATRRALRIDCSLCASPLSGRHE